MTLEYLILPALTGLALGIIAVFVGNWLRDL